MTHEGEWKLVARNNQGEVRAWLSFDGEPWSVTNLLEVVQGWAEADPTRVVTLEIAKPLPSPRSPPHDRRNEDGAPFTGRSPHHAPLPHEMRTLAAGNRLVCRRRGETGGRRAAGVC